MEPHPTPGQVVRVRSRRFLVEDVARPGDGAGGHEQTVVSLSCIDDDAQGYSVRVLWETELDAEVLTQSAWQRVATRGFDSPRLFASYLNTLRWNLVTSTNPRLFQAPYRAGIEVMAYQLEPLRKALALPRVTLFIADDVGLGKTIEAGLIVRELLLRQKVRRIVVSCPPSVVLQCRAPDPARRFPRRLSLDVDTPVGSRCERRASRPRSSSLRHTTRELLDFPPSLADASSCTRRTRRCAAA